MENNLKTGLETGSETNLEKSLETQTTNPNSITVDGNDFGFEVLTVQDFPMPMVVLPLPSFLSMSNALLFLNIEVKDESIMELNSKIQTKLASLENLDIKYKNASLKDNIDFILKIARCEQ
jgi:hypothetical protein